MCSVFLLRGLAKQLGLSFLANWAEDRGYSNTYIFFLYMYVCILQNLNTIRSWKIYSREQKRRRVYSSQEMSSSFSLFPLASSRPFRTDRHDWFVPLSFLNHVDNLRNAFMLSATRIHLFTTSLCLTHHPPFLNHIFHLNGNMVNIC